MAPRAGPPGGADGGARTHDLPLTRRLLCRLSYVGPGRGPIVSSPGRAPGTGGYGRGRWRSPAPSVHLPVVGVDDVVLGRSLAGGRLRSGRAAARARLLVDVLANLLERQVEVVHGLAKGARVAALGGASERLELGLDLAANVGGDAVAVLLEHLLGLVDHLVGLVADLHLLPAGAVLRRVLLGLFHQPLDLVLAQGRGGSDGDRLLAAGAQVLGLDVEDAVGVDVEGDLDLGHAARGRRDAVEVEPAEGAVVPGELTLTLQHVDLDRGLVVGGGAEDLRARGGDGGVALDQLGEDPAQGLDTQRE